MRETHIGVVLPSILEGAPAAAQGGDLKTPVNSEAFVEARAVGLFPAVVGAL